jgi:hypothetical protein
LLIVPGLAVFFGLLLQFLGWNLKRQGKSAVAWTGLSLLVLALGAYVGFKVMWNLFDPELGSFYRSTIWQRRILVMHYVAFGLPLICFLAVVAWNAAEKKLGRPLMVSA